MCFGFLYFALVFGFEFKILIFPGFSALKIGEWINDLCDFSWGFLYIF